MLAEGDWDFSKLSLENTFVIGGMFALAARFSTSKYFQDIDLKERGNIFAIKSQVVFREARLRAGSQYASLKWLQGCILLAYYHQACRPPWQEDFPLVACIRLAHRLELHSIDEMVPDLSDNTTVSEWMSKEEKRRAWWVVWELDAFDAVMKHHPFLLDRNRMHVRLPVSDEDWFAGTPKASEAIIGDVSQCWRSLRDTPNKDPKAWFYISNYFLAQALELCQRRKVAHKSVRDLENAIICFSHLVHERFRVAPSAFPSDEDKIIYDNWLTMARLMLYRYGRTSLKADRC